MTAPAVTDRDLAVLRSFAQRVDPHDPGAHNNLGVLLFRKGLVDEAIEAFQRALELDPTMLPARENLDKAYRESPTYRARLAALEGAVRASPEAHAERLELARAYAALGRPDEAREQLQILLRWRPDDREAQLALGRVEAARGDLEAASEWFARVVAAEPGHADAHFRLGRALYNRGLAEAALSELRAAVAADPDHAEAHHLMGFVLGELGYPEEAAEASTTAVHLSPSLAHAQANLTLEHPVVRTPAEDGPRIRTLPREGRDPVPVERTGERPAPLAHYALGVAFRRKGFHLEALRELRLALAAGEPPRAVEEAMAEVQLLRRDHAAAIELYDRLVREHPDAPKLWNERGVALHQAGRADEAMASYARAVGLDAGYALAWANLGVLRAQRGQLDAALEALTLAAEAPAVPVGVTLDLALLRVQRREPQLALEAYRQALARDPRSAVAWTGVGQVLLGLRRPEDARNAFGRAIDGDPRHAPAHYNLAFALAQLGDHDAARRATERALTLAPFYVAQKYVLVLALQLEDPALSIPADVSGELGGEALAGEFAFDQTAFDRLFGELEPDAEATAVMPSVSARELLALGGRFQREGFFGEALERFRQALVLEPLLREATLGELRALVALGRTGEAAPLAEAWLQRAPQDVDALVMAARGRLATGALRPALDVVRRAALAAPGRLDVRRVEALVLRAQGDRAGARGVLVAALEADGDVPAAWLELGRLEEEDGRPVAARQAYDRAAALLPTWWPATEALAALLLRQGDARGAVRALADFLARDTTASQALLALGRALLAAGRAADAASALDRALRLDPTLGDARFLRAEALALLRRFPEARGEWERVVQADPQGQLAERARQRLRSARDLQHILARR
ncbi:MAG: tetratricopeptide repeat protein [Gemmatimonadales bacterium]|nr:tetratricopeptide repeat protein [Gemmatimonadales bacterium]